jgi:hypothetical protein
MRAGAISLLARALDPFHTALNLVDAAAIRPRGPEKEMPRGARSATRACHAALPIDGRTAAVCEAAAQRRGLSGERSGEHRIDPVMRAQWIAMAGPKTPPRLTALAPRGER